MSTFHSVTCDDCSTEEPLVWSGRQEWDPYHLPKGWVENGALDICPDCWAKREQKEQFVAQKAPHHGD